MTGCDSLIIQLYRLHLSIHFLSEKMCLFIESQTMERYVETTGLQSRLTDQLNQHREGMARQLSQRDHTQSHPVS